LPATEIAAQINASQSSSNSHISTRTVQRLSESSLHDWIAAKKTLFKNTNKKRLAWAKKHKQLTLDRWKVQIGDFWFQPPCLWDAE
jgi:hypothetical protein